MSYDDNSKPQHRNALRQVAESRQRALSAVGQIRKRTVDSPHPNLAPTFGSGEASIHSEVNQAVVDYLLHLRPYRHSSEKWKVDFAGIELPWSIAGDPKPGRRRGNSRPLRICQNPEVELSPISNLIHAVNSDVYYSSDYSSSGSSGGWTPPSQRKKTIDVRCEDETITAHRDDAEAFLSGAIGADELRTISSATAGKEGEEDEFVPASPNGEHVKRFKFVFSPEQLQRIIELADEVAAEMDLLVDIKLPDHQAGGGGAV